MDEKTIVLGFDGMDIRYLRDAIKERDLPNFEKLRDEGVLGEMTSIHPPTTIPAWPSMFTGKNPGKLGMFHFQELDRDTGEFSPYDMTQLYGKFIWDSGIETAINFLPSLTPPYEIEGRILEGIPGQKDFRTHPEDLKQEITNEEEMEVFHRDFSDSMEQSFAYYDTRREIMKRMHEEYSQELMINVYRPTDAVAHYREDIESFYDVYERMDEELGYYLEKADEEGFNLFIVADHGANHTERAFFINTWLEENGYLELTDEGEESENDLLLSVANRLINLGLRRPLEVGHSLIQRFTGKSFKPNKGAVSDQVDWENSDGVAYLIGALPTIGVMLNEEKLGEKLEERREEIIEELEKEDAVDWVKKREELYSGEKIEEIPHIVVRGKEDVMMKSMIYPDVEIKFDKYGHGYAVVFGAYGEDIQHQEDYTCSLLDIAPTLLASMNRDVPEDMDGEVLQELFREERDVNYREPIDASVDEKDDEREDEIKNRLEEMGYMSD
jgi:predicted AlkP superfamily phosphohydrolase/phosphomutase